MEEKLYIPVILGTGREGNQSQKVAQYLFEELKKDEAVETEVIDVSDLEWKTTVPPWQDKTTNPPYHTQFQRADGFVLVTPEYNHGYPGELKIFLDSMYDEYNDKPMGVCGVSNGRLGGARVVEHIKPILIELGVVPIRRTMYFPNVDELFDADGKILDEGYVKRMEDFKSMLVWYAHTLKYGRTNINRA